MRLYELGLQKSCYKVANRFADEDMQLAGNRTCAILRAPWWDIVKGETPGLLQRKTVRVYNKDGSELIEKRNPLRKYCFKVCCGGGGLGLGRIGQHSSCGCEIQMMFSYRIVADGHR